MRVTVHYLAQLRRATKLAVESVELGAPATLGELLVLLVQTHGDQLRKLLLDEAGGPRSSLLVFINDEQTDHPRNCFLKDGDSVTFLSPIAGG
jgi:molybdopterin converting factor small subunit